MSGINLKIALLYIFMYGGLSVQPKLSVAKLILILIIINSIPLRFLKFERFFMKHLNTVFSDLT